MAGCRSDRTLFLLCKEYVLGISARNKRGGMHAQRSEVGRKAWDLGGKKQGVTEDTVGKEQTWCESHIAVMSSNCNT